MALTGNQKKIDKNKNNRIDAQDFDILKAEKAKGRGQGLQDEKMKPGKTMKAMDGGMAEDRAREGKKAQYKKMGFGQLMKEGTINFGDKHPILKAKKEKQKKYQNPKKDERFYSAFKDRMTNLGLGDIAGDPRKVQRKMGGGMMMRPMGYSKGKSVMAKGCKLGRKKPTKMY